MLPTEEVQGARSLMRLSAREREVLRLVAEGHRAAAVAARCGIALSTVEKHLAAIRRRLRVGRTGQAVALYWRFRLERAVARQAEQGALEGCRSHPGLAAAFVRELEQCGSFAEGWRALDAHMRCLGFRGCTLGLVAEPFGEVTTGARILVAEQPPETIESFSRLGGLSRDPVVRAFAVHREDRAFGLAELAARYRREFRTPALGRAALAMLVADQGVFVLPEIDPLSGVPYGLVLGGDRECLRRFHRDDGTFSAHLHAVQRLFWETAKQRRWLAERAGLTRHQAQALALAARGLGSSEIAARLGLGRSSVEKRLAGARAALGAPTVAAAVFRATVYGALGGEAVA